MSRDAVRFSRTASSIDVEHGMRMRVVELEVLAVQLETDICRIMTRVLEERMRLMLGSWSSFEHWSSRRRCLGQTGLRARWRAKNDTTQAPNSTTQLL